MRGRGNRVKVGLSSLQSEMNSGGVVRRNPPRPARGMAIIAEATFSHEPPESRLDTFYGWIYGTNQGPHTMPYKLMSEFIYNENTSIEDIKTQIISPEDWRKIIENEEIINTDSPKFLSMYAKYSEYYERFKYAEEYNIKDDARSDYANDTNSLGYLSCAEILINLHPYATYHWRDKHPINSSGEEGKAMLDGDGSEKRAATVYQKGGSINKKLGFQMLDGLNPELNQFHDQNGFKIFLNLRLSAVLDEDVRVQIMERVEECLSQNSMKTDRTTAEQSPSASDTYSSNDEETDYTDEDSPGFASEKMNEYEEPGRPHRPQLIHSDLVYQMDNPWLFDKQNHNVYEDSGCIDEYRNGRLQNDHPGVKRNFTDMMQQFGPTDQTYHERIRKKTTKKAPQHSFGKL